MSTDKGYDEEALEYANKVSTEGNVCDGEKWSTAYTSFIAGRQSSNEAKLKKAIRQAVKDLRTVDGIGLDDIVNHLEEAIESRESKDCVFPACNCIEELKRCRFEPSDTDHECRYRDAIFKPVMSQQEWEKRRNEEAEAGRTAAANEIDNQIINESYGIANYHERRWWIDGAKWAAAKGGQEVIAEKAIREVLKKIYSDHSIHLHMWHIKKIEDFVAEYLSQFSSPPSPENK
jgi:hypothetical protein